MERSAQTDTVPLPQTTQAATQTGPPMRNYQAELKAEIARTKYVEQRHNEAIGQLQEQAANREGEIKEMIDEHSDALKAKEKEVLDLQVTLIEANERVLREEEKHRQKEQELFVENLDIRNQQRDLKEMANEIMLKWRIAEEQRAQLSDSYHELQA